MKKLFGLLILFGFIFVIGCRPNAVSTENATTSISTGTVSSTLPPEYNEGIDMSDLTTTPDPQAQKMVQLAKESLMRKFNISEDQIHLFSVEAMIWPDASLGCPRAGIVYDQALTPGFQILFEAIGQSYTYHTDNLNKVILCRIHPPDEIFLTP